MRVVDIDEASDDEYWNDVQPYDLPNLSIESVSKTRELLHVPESEVPRIQRQLLDDYDMKRDEVSLSKAKCTREKAKRL